VSPLRPPFSAAARERLRLRILAAIAGMCVFFVTVVYVSTVSALRPAGFAVPVALYACFTSAASSLFLFYCLSADYRSRRGWRLVFGLVFASGFAIVVLGIARERWHLAVPEAVAVTVCAAAAGGLFAIYHSSKSARLALAWSIRRPTDRRAAREAHDASLYAMNSRSASDEQKKTARLNRARAAIAESRGDDAPDGLVAATADLIALLDDPPDDWLLLWAAASDLVDAVSVRAEKHGDIGGYPEALRVLADAAERMPADLGAMAVVRERRAGYHAALADRLPPGPAADAHAAEAVAELRAAIAMASASLRHLLPQWHARLGLWVARVRADPADLMAGIELCREAIRLAGYRPLARAFTREVLAILLIDLAAEAADGLSWDASDTDWAAAARTAHRALTEARRHLRYARRYGGKDMRAEVLDLQAQVRTERAILTGGHPRAEAQAVRAWQAAARAVANGDPFDRVQVGRAWAAWAEVTEEAAWCAEAYWNLMSVVPPAIAVRYLADERNRMLAGLQSSAEEAGYWLAEAGRIADAAIALELGRAVSLSDVLAREQPGLPAALIRAGREDLALRFRAAVKEYDAVRAPGHDEGLSSAQQRAWAAYDAVVRDIATVLDIDLPGALPTLAELTMAARDGPLVYLAASTRGGYAIVVSAGSAPVYRPLAGLAKADVAERVAAFLREAGPDEVVAMARWLWDDGIRALARELPAGALVTIIPVGLVSLLPVHAAGGPTAAMQHPGDWTYLADRVTVRYAPNARALIRARDRAGRFQPETLTLLAITAQAGELHAPTSESQERLKYTVPEVTRIARRWARADIVADAAPIPVEGMLASHTVWHFACHCSVVPDSILESALLLTGGQLSLRRILALPSAPRRLAILSACDTHLSGTELPDEAIGLPAGLLQAGFAGVVACNWRVPDRSTAYLMIRFHELWHGQGLAPATALAEAQRWLRAATAAELAACLDGAPAGIDGPGDGLAEDPSAVPARARAAGRYGHPYFWAAFALTGQ
jgi:CHAT domain-containing protein